MSKKAFLAALREELIERYQWAQNKTKLDDFITRTAMTMQTISNLVNIDGDAFTAAWRAIGNTGKPTFKALRELPHGIDWTAWAKEDGAELIEGCGQFRAGHGAIVTDWCPTAEAAYHAFCVLKHGKLEAA